MQFIFEIVKGTARECHGGQNKSGFKKVLMWLHDILIAIKLDGVNSNSSSGSYRLPETRDVLGPKHHFLLNLVSPGICSHPPTAGRVATEHTEPLVWITAAVLTFLYNYISAHPFNYSVTVWTV